MGTQTRRQPTNRCISSVWELTDEELSTHRQGLQHTTHDHPDDTAPHSHEITDEPLGKAPNELHRTAIRNRDCTRAAGTRRRTRSA